MVRKRGPFGRIEKVMSKKRPIGAISETSAPVPRKKDRNLLNDRILSLYKEEISIDDKSSLIQNEEEISYDEQPKNVQNTENVKSSNKSSKIADKKKNSVLTPKHSSLSFKDVGGLDGLLVKVLKLFLHIKDPELFTELSVPPIRGFLLHGPPGCGKTHLARAVAGELNLPYIEIAATELVCGISGESERKIRDMFEEAVKCAPSILFIDEIDAVIPKRETTEKGMERRMVAQLLICLDELNEKDISTSVMVIGATNRPDSIDPALRRGGRFDKELAIGMPDETSRLKILQVLFKGLKLAPNFNMQWLAHHTPGYVGADLKSLITEAVEVGISRIYKKLITSCSESRNSITDCQSNFEWKPGSEITLDLIQSWFKSKLKIPEAELVNIYFEQQDFEVAIQNCIPYSKREGFATVPDVTWDDVGALEDIEEQLQASILWPVKYREEFESSGMSSTKGILLYGPKGCGKTLLAKAIANECSINFLSVKGPELLSMYLGESEKAVRQCFERARNSAPCVIFFDEIDALCPKRSSSNLNAAAERVVNQLLTEMDGMEERKQVFVVGATNRLEKIDSAMLRPGRLEELIYVDIPSDEGRVDILRKITKDKTRPKIADDVILKSLAEQCKNFSGADLAYLVRKAFSNAMKDRISSANFSKKIEIHQKHFDKALEVVKPSISEKEREYYRSLVHRS